MKLASLTAIAVFSLTQVQCTVTQEEGQDASARIALRTVSTRADRVSGGDVLVEVVAPWSDASSAVKVTLNDNDVTSEFRDVGTRRSRVAFITGLTIGTNRLHAEAPGVTAGSLEITNYPITGPIISGPHMQPFVCGTEQFKLPDGTTLGPPLDENCTVATRVTYLYLPVSSSELRPLADVSVLPSDVAMTTTTVGTQVPFVVRLETGTLNRGIYQNAILHDPTSEPGPTPFAPPRGWNRRLIALHGVGCPGGWYRQGAAMGVDLLNVARLGEGYALFTNTLNSPNVSCNAFLAGETTMMGKERFIETFGLPSFTVSMGGSGGSYTTLQVADAFPGLFDGVLVTASFPDALSIALAGLDGHLLTHYFEMPQGSVLSDTQKVAISGYSGMRALIDAANQAQRTDPVPGRVDIEGYNSARWNEEVPEEYRYDPSKNVRGVRPTVFDIARNVYGVDAETGFALRPYDNVGVQYGLEALNDGVISPAQFLALNEGIGGYDQDANYAAARSVGNAGAIERAYQSGLTLSGGGGLATIPVFEASSYNEARGYHYEWFHFAVRERMRHANGHADNHQMWRGHVPADQAWAVLMRWLEGISTDTSNASSPEKMQRHRPPEAVDGCWTEPTEDQPSTFIEEQATFSERPDTACNRLYPSYSFVRHAAGGPLDGNVLKCQLKPVDMEEYAVQFSDDERTRLRHIFSAGVCDWSKPGVKQGPVRTWASFGPAPEGLIFDLTLGG